MSETSPASTTRNLCKALGIATILGGSTLLAGLFIYPISSFAPFSLISILLFSVCATMSGVLAYKCNRRFFPLLLIICGSVIVPNIVAYVASGLNPLRLLKEVPNIVDTRIEQGDNPFAVWYQGYWLTFMWPLWNILIAAMGIYCFVLLTKGNDLS